MKIRFTPTDAENLATDGMLDLYQWLTSSGIYSTTLVQAWKDELSEDYTFSLKKSMDQSPGGEKEKLRLRLRVEAWKVRAPNLLEDMSP